MFYDFEHLYFTLETARKSDFETHLPLSKMDVLFILDCASNTDEHNKNSLSIGNLLKVSAFS